MRHLGNRTIKVNKSNLIEKIKENKSNHIKEYGENGRKFVESKYRIEHTISQFYSHIINWLNINFNTFHLVYLSGSDQSWDCE